MSFFERKPVKAAKPRPKPPVEVGHRFTYLGLNILCTRHWTLSGYGVAEAVVAEHMNALGEIKHTTFYPCDWAALEAEMTRTALFPAYPARVAWKAACEACALLADGYAEGGGGPGYSNLAAEIRALPVPNAHDR